MEPFLKIGLLLSLLLTGATTASLSSAAEIVAPVDAQHFEQAYEDWTKKIIHELNPKLKFTVLSQIDFSRNPAQLQEYDDLKAVNHLPGLPEVLDQNYTNPLESPLYALVARKSFKIISYTALQTQELAILREVLNNKLKLRGEDTLSFEMVNPNPTSVQFKHNLKAEFALLFGLFLVAASALTYRRKMLAKPVLKIDAKVAAIKPVEKALSTPPALKPALAGIHQIQMAPVEALRKCLAQEKPETIGRASLHASRKFHQYLIGECGSDKFDQVVQWLKLNEKAVTAQDASYARLLLTAKLQQIQNTVVLDSIDAFHHARMMKMKLNKTYTAVQSPEVREANL